MRSEATAGPGVGWSREAIQGCLGGKNPPDPVDGGLEVGGDPWDSGWPCWVGILVSPREGGGDGSRGDHESGFGQVSLRSRLAWVEGQGMDMWARGSGRVPAQPVRRGWEGQAGKIP